ncbi:MAG: NAD(P)-binding domain-containing protein [Deltaproteobacteria bacterium]|nr:NAD(P)-binding domain-containing protein [Deltaproteobacteria bacterium]
MKIGILGTGDVGKALGRGFLATGHEVLLGAREAGNAKAREWAEAQGPKARAGTFAEAAEYGELIVLATLGTAVVEATKLAGPAHFAGKVVVDTTNPLDLSKGFPPTLAVSGEDSGGERVQRALPDARVVKAWNSVGNALMFRPELPGGPPTMFRCGNDAEAKATVAGILEAWGWSPMDAGDIRSSRYLEALCILWVSTAARGNHWLQAFKMLRP